MNAPSVRLAAAGTATAIAACGARAVAGSAACRANAGPGSQALHPLHTFTCMDGDEEQARTYIFFLLRSRLPAAKPRTPAAPGARPLRWASSAPPRVFSVTAGVPAGHRTGAPASRRARAAALPSAAAATARAAPALRLRQAGGAGQRRARSLAGRALLEAGGLGEVAAAGLLHGHARQARHVHGLEHVQGVLVHLQSEGGRWVGRARCGSAGQRRQRQKCGLHPGGRARSRSRRARRGLPAAARPAAACGRDRTPSAPRWPPR